MTVLTETLHAGGFLIREANGDRSREQITIAGGIGDLVAGQVISQRADGKWVDYDNSVSSGAGGAAEGILFADSPETGADREAVGIVREATVNEDELDWGDNNTAGITAGLAELRALQIIPR